MQRNSSGEAVGKTGPNAIEAKGWNDVMAGLPFCREYETAAESWQLNYETGQIWAMQARTAGVAATLVAGKPFPPRVFSVLLRDKTLAVPHVNRQPDSSSLTFTPSLDSHGRLRPIPQTHASFAPLPPIVQGFAKPDVADALTKLGF